MVADTSFGIVCTATFTINEPPPISIVNTNSVNASNGNCDGELGYTVTGGVSPYIFVLDTCHGGSPVTTPQFMSSYNNLCPGAYTLNVTDVNGCIASGPCDTLVECNIQFTGAISHPTCPNACDGSIVLNAISPNLSFLWTIGSTTQSITNLCAGTYCVTIIDTVTGCQTDTCFTIVDPVQLIGTVLATDVSCHGDCDGEITGSYFWWCGTIRLFNR